MNNQQITFKDKGNGPAILFVPGSFSTPAAWREIQNALPPGFRMITTSLLGYGNTAETRNLEDFDMDHEIAMLAQVGKMIGEPVHLVGHSFGATVGLAASIAGVLDVLSITTFEANPIALLPQQDEQDLFAEVKLMNAEFEEAYQSGEHHAARRIIDFWGGRGSFSAMPGPVQDYCQTTTFANVLDWRCVYTFEATMDDFKKLDMPALIVKSEHCNPAMTKITNALLSALPNAKPAIVNNANHFLITSHASQCARLLTNHLADFT